MHDTLTPLLESDFPPLTRGALGTLQINLGYLCNQTCLHCHVNAGPRRTELMQWETMQTLLDFLDNSQVHTVDLTGGAPEMNPYFRRFVKALRERDIKVIDRCNLTILTEADQNAPVQADLAGFLAEQQVDIVASLPCYQEDNVDNQRGKGVFQRSIEGLLKLNALGYGQSGSDLLLNLVYNPQGPSLPPPQESLESAYKIRLYEEYGIVFNQLFTITNMPIQRFGSTLISKGQYDTYMDLLKTNYSEANCEAVMCRSTLSVDWQGYVYDCDFNQMLKLSRPVGRQHISALTADALKDQPISVLDHCYGCTAGQGSSCGGALD